LSGEITFLGCFFGPLGEFSFSARSLFLTLALFGREGPLAEVVSARNTFSVSILINFRDRLMIGGGDEDIRFNQIFFILTHMNPNIVK
jgi:hypothetical protein